jgi:hypothetical protein
MDDLFQINTLRENFHGHDTRSARKSPGKNCSMYGGEIGQLPFGDSRINLIPMEKGLRRLESRLGKFQARELIDTGPKPIIEIFKSIKTGVV